MICFENSCVTQTQKDQMLLNSMYESTVKIEHTYGSGSGVVLSHVTDGNGSKTLILTNEHVIDNANGISDIKITTNRREILSADEVRIAPKLMDLAVIYVNGTYGSPVVAASLGDFGPGADVMAVGSPFGLEGSVTKGVVTNFIVTDYIYNGTQYNSYNLVMTDSAINPGNSGGGLFLKENGKIIGIITFKIAGFAVDTAGFAIRFDEVSRLGTYDDWESINPYPKCEDGTQYAHCSNVTMGYYCSSVGNFVPNCQMCGCSEGYACDYTNDGIGPGLRECFYCKSPWVSNRDGTCCEPGSRWASPGRCVAG